MTLFTLTGFECRRFSVLTYGALIPATMVLPRNMSEGIMLALRDLYCSSIAAVASDRLSFLSFVVFSQAHYDVFTSEATQYPSEDPPCPPQTASSHRLSRPRGYC